MSAGRTTHMIQQAREAAARGETVLIVAANHQEVRRIRAFVADCPSITVQSFEERPRGAHFTHTYWDHYAQECAWRSARYRP